MYASVDFALSSDLVFSISRPKIDHVDIDSAISRERSICVIGKQPMIFVDEPLLPSSFQKSSIVFT
jgi:hypothetical protein